MRDEAVGHLALRKLTSCRLLSSYSQIVFTAYSITSPNLINGQCVTTSGNPVAVDTPYTRTQGTQVADSAFRSSALAAFVASLGFESCSGGAGEAPIASIPITDLTGTSFSEEPATSSPTNLHPSSTTPTSSAEPTSSSTSSQIEAEKTGLETQANVGIGIGIPLAVIIALVFAGRRCLHYRSRKLKERAGENEAPSEEHQPYLQQKGELEAEEKRKYELQAEERRYELKENEIFEMPTEEVKSKRFHLRRQELRGEEHCQGLDDLESRSNGGLIQASSSRTE